MPALTTSAPADAALRRVATDPGTYIAVTMLLACVALLAIYIPARQATRMDPADALRRK